MTLINTTTYRERIVRARRARRCDDRGTIAAGELYLLCTEYPGGDSGYADSAGHPVRMRICQRCAPRKFEDAAGAVSR